jgi:two-component system alkaline phosphatase synthesis response regulator PhoP
MIAVVEDDNSIRELVCYTLNKTGFTAKGFIKGEAFYNYLEEDVPELLLLDVMLPDEDGISILRKIKLNKKTEKIPVIMLTAKDSEYDKIIGLDSGADDYVTKPFAIMELISRIKAVLRRTNEISVKYKNIFSFKELILDNTAHTVYAKGKLVELTLKEHKLLKLLLENEGCVINRELLLEKIWGYTFDGETRTVDVHIRTLRSKLKECGEYIETIRGIGYRIGHGR